MSFRDTQNPGIGGLEELTDAEQLFVQNLAGLSFANGDILYYNNGLQRLPKGSDSDVLTLASGLPSWAAGGGSGTVTSVSVASANGFAGSVANATSTPAITISTTITGLLKGNGTAVSAAVAGTDYVVPSVTTLSSLVSIGTITTGVWNASVIPGQYGGTGVANTGKTFTIGGNFETSGAFTTTLVVTGNTSVTLPTTGTLATLAGAEAFSNKTFSTVLTPTSSDGAALGTGTLMWSDLFLASGAVINFNNSNVVLTHTSGILTMGTGELRITTAGTNTASVVTVGGAQNLTSKVLTAATITTSLTPTSSDGAALGSGTLMFSDLFLASGGVISFNNGDVTLTHSSNLLALGGGQFSFGANTAYFTETDNGNSSTADTIDWTVSNKQKSTLTGNCEFTFTAPGGPCNLVLKLVQDATGSRTVTWPAAVHWPGGTAPTLTTTANKVDIITFYYDGTTYFGFYGLNYTA